MHPAIESRSNPGSRAPHQSKEFSSIEVAGLRAEKGLESPPEVRTLPRAQAIALCRNPEITQAGQQGKGHIGMTKPFVSYALLEDDFSWAAAESKNCCRIFFATLSIMRWPTDAINPPT